MWPWILLYHWCKHSHSNREPYRKWRNLSPWIQVSRGNSNTWRLCSGILPGRVISLCYLSVDSHGLAEIKCKHNSCLDKLKTFFYEISYSVRLCFIIYFLTMFDDDLLTVAIRRIFSRRTRSLVALDSESLYKDKMHR